jgi:hypothetical protein
MAGVLTEARISLKVGSVRQPIQRFLRRRLQETSGAVPPIFRTLYFQLLKETSYELH